MRDDIPHAPDQFRLTLNKPAMSLVVGDAPALDFRVDGGVYLRPSRANSAFRVEPRGDRGGGEVTLEGPRAADIWTALHRLAEGRGRPFYSLQRAGDLFRLVSEATAPGRHVPHLRLWGGRVEVAALDVEHMYEPMWSAKVREAFAIVAAHEASGRLGRPSKEIVQAQETVETFRRLAADLLPQGVDREAVQQAHELLAKSLR